MSRLPRRLFEQRLAALQSMLIARGHGAAIVDQTETLYFYTGFDLSEIVYRGLVVPAAGAPVLLVRRTDVGAFQDHSVIADCRGYLDWEDGIAALAGILRETTPDDASIAVDLHSYVMTPRRLAQLGAAIGNRAIVDVGSWFSDRRMVKAPEEIALLRAAAGIADRILPVFAAALRPGETVRAATAAASAEAVRAGADHGRIGLVALADGLDFFHKPPPARPVVEGDAVHVELTPRVGGYSGRLMRPVVVGAPTAEQRERAAAVIALQDAQIAAMTPGRKASEVDAIVREGLVKAGLRPAVPNATGYTLGHYPVSTPRTSEHHRALSPVADWPLEAGMAFHVVASTVGLAFSETVLVTADDPVRLTTTGRRIFSAG
ncbi:MAG: M24 family metallopeptidase [Alphaproteobacteria bacterium]